MPVFKAGDHNSANNYRPISLLSNTSKVLEQIIYSKIIRRHISPLQFGFSRSCSILQQMLIFLDHIIKSPLQSDVIYFDISKAFDTVSHSILLNKLWSIGITGVLWTWFKYYLTNRYQRVAINNYFSDLLPVISGVPQGSILGPLLFLVYINDMQECIRHSLFLIFADNTKCFKHIHTITDHNTLQEDINSFFT